ncbi:MAG: hypothetical protein JXR45_21265 [Deltaproteobacteria bacterium]|nr:hypothetical protein [Deltaproteobacteria bacterium]
MKYYRINKHIATSTYTSPNGLKETYIFITGINNSTRFSDVLKTLNTFVDHAIDCTGISMHALMFSRVYLSDVENQKRSLLTSLVYSRLCSGVVSVIGQPLLSGDAVSVLLYFVDGVLRKPLNHGFSGYRHVIDDDPWCNELIFEGRNYNMLWVANYTADTNEDAYSQTKTLLTRINTTLESHNLTMRNNLLRTWLYIRDVDNHYLGMANARRKSFEQFGLKRDSRFPASTGIEGKAHSSNRFVSMDGVAISGLREEQIVKMEARDYICPTIQYGVTFERGIRIRFGDRSHLHISGTASINNKGQVMYPGDILKQTERVITIISALLDTQNASMNQMAYIILYLRDPSHYEIVKNYLLKNISHDIPLIPVAAAVCRPGWLVEMEGVAIVPDKTSFPPFL